VRCCSAGPATTAIRTTSCRAARLRRGRQRQPRPVVPQPFDDLIQAPRSSPTRPSAPSSTSRPRSSSRSRRRGRPSRTRSCSSPCARKVQDFASIRSAATSSTASISPSNRTGPHLGRSSVPAPPARRPGRLSPPRACRRSPGERQGAPECAAFSSPGWGYLIPTFIGVTIVPSPSSGCCRAIPSAAGRRARHRAPERHAQLMGSSATTSRSGAVRHLLSRRAVRATSARSIVTKRRCWTSS
jgi:hypothetical protein